MAAALCLLGQVRNHSLRGTRMRVLWCLVVRVAWLGWMEEKVWRLCSSSRVLIHCMNQLKCPGDHEHSKMFVLKNTQHYPEAFAHTALRALSAW